MRLRTRFHLYGIREVQMALYGRYETTRNGKAYHISRSRGSINVAVVGNAMPRSSVDMNQTFWKNLMPPCPLYDTEEVPTTLSNAVSEIKYGDRQVRSFHSLDTVYTAVLMQIAKTPKC